jgi:ParB/RepB/Spo0J family partition protein
MKDAADAKTYVSPEIKTNEDSVQKLSPKLLALMDLTIRLNFSEEETKKLAESFKNHGILEPLLVRPSHAEEGKYEVVCGARRFKAAQKAGLTAVPCVIKEMGDTEAMEAMLAENKERENLSDYEMGRWFKLLMERFPDKYPTLQAMAERFGYKDHTQVVHLINHYEAVEQLKRAVSPNIVTRVTMLPEFLVREVRRAPVELQPAIVEAIIEAQDKHARGEAEFAPSARDVAAYVDSQIDNWEKVLQKMAEKAEEEKEEKEKGKPKPEQPKQPVKPKPEAEEGVEQPSLPSKEDVARGLAKVVEQRRKKAEEVRREEEAFAITLVKYYPEDFRDYVLSYVSEDAPFDKVLQLFHAVIEVLWHKCNEEGKTEEVMREASSWLKW